MTSDDLPKFASLMHTLGSLYKEDVTETLSDVYWHSLKPFEWLDVKKAVAQHIANPDQGQFMPKPADFVRWIEGTYASRALKAWVKMLETIQRVGLYESVAFDDPMIHVVIEALGGWVSVCRSKTNDLPLMAQQFQKYYVTCLTHPPCQIPTYLVGMFGSSEPIQIEQDTQQPEKLTKAVTSHANILPDVQTEQPTKKEWSTLC